MERPSVVDGARRPGSPDHPEALRVERGEIHPRNCLPRPRHPRLLGSARLLKYGRSVDGRSIWLNAGRRGWPGVPRIGRAEFVQALLSPPHAGDRLTTPAVTSHRAICDSLSLLRRAWYRRDSLNP